MNELSWPKRSALKRLLAAGVSQRKICVLLPCGKATVVRYARLWKVAAMCGCGNRAGHRGWCHVRLAYSPKRRAWLAANWNARGGNMIASTVDRAYAEAKALRHQLGPFVWGSAGMSSGLAYALCGVCGQIARIADGSIDGTAVRDKCLSASQRAALKAAHQEKREWRNAKKTLHAIRDNLRPPNLRTRASAPGPSSPA